MSERPPSAMTPATEGAPPAMPPPTTERPLRAMIAAVSPEGVIGRDGKIPWHYPADLKRFKRVTTGAAVVMGRLTWESMNGRPLPGRRNLVLTSGPPVVGAETFRDVPSVLAAEPGPLWFIGGSRVYAEAMPFCDLIDLTYVPDSVPVEGAATFPPIDPAVWDGGALLVHEDDPRLGRREWRRRR